MKLTGVTGILSASHRAIGGGVHGHTWRITVWTPAEPRRDAEALKARLDALLAVWKNDMLPDEIVQGEDLAEAVAVLLGDCVEVLVERPDERISARWTP
jgi:hypothetical protein